MTMASDDIEILTDGVFLKRRRSFQEYLSRAEAARDRGDNREAAYKFAQAATTAESEGNFRDASRYHDTASNFAYDSGRRILSMVENKFAGRCLEEMQEDGRAYLQYKQAVDKGLSFLSFQESRREPKLQLISALNRHVIECRLHAARSAMREMVRVGEEPGPDGEGFFWEAAALQLIAARKKLIELRHKGHSVQGLEREYNRSLEVIEDKELGRRLGTLPANTSRGARRF